MTDLDADIEPRPGQADPLVAAELEQSRVRMAAAEAELAAIRASTSWRLTAPLRRILGLFRGGHGVGRAAETADPLLRFPAALPGELRRAEMPPARSEASARTVDAAPLLAALLPAEPSCLPRSADAFADAVPYARGSLRVAVAANVEFVREMALCVEAMPLEAPQRDTRVFEQRPELALFVADGRSSFDAEWLLFMTAAARSQSIPVAAWIWDSTDPAAIPLCRQADGIWVTDETARSELVQACPGIEAHLLPLGVALNLYNPIRTPTLQRIGSMLERHWLCDDLSSRLDRLKDETDAGDPAELHCESYWDIPASRVAGILSEASNVIGVLRPEDKLALWKAGIGESLVPDPHKPAWWRKQQALRAAACGAQLRVAGSAAAPAQGVGQAWVSTGQIRAPAVLVDMAAAHHSVRQAAQEDLTLRLEAMCRRLVGRTDGGPPPMLVSCLLVSKRPKLAADAVASMMRQTYPALEIVVLLHGAKAVDVARFRDQAPEQVRTLVAPDHHSLGACLNQAFASCSGSYWLKIDDDDLYGQHYVEDLMRLASSVDHDIIGKPLAFTLFEADDALYVDPRMLEGSNMIHRGKWAKGSVCGATLGGRSKVLREHPFPTHRRHGVDSAFLDACAAAGLSLLVADPFNFTCTRGDARRQHTWVGNERDVRARGIRLGGRASVDHLVNI